MLIEIDDLKKQLNSKLPAEALRAEKEAAALAEQGSIEAAEMLVTAYADGTDVIHADRIKEFKYTRMAAEQGSAFSRFWLANLQHQSNDYAGALENARLAHEMGDSNATTLLARMMLAGEGQAAKPLEALQLLAESVESRSNADAAILLAEVCLDGKHIPRNPQNAYAALQRQAATLSVMRHVAPHLYARSLYLKAEAVRLGAKPTEGESYAGLIDKAAEAGDQQARAERQEHQTDAEWNAICRFTAYRGKWEMFFKVATLEASSNKSHTSVSGHNGTIRSTTSHWQVTAFRTASGHAFEVSLPANVSLVQGREYAVLYIGPESEDRGTPTTIFDLTDGSVIKATGDFIANYPKNGSRLLAGVGALLMGIGVLAAFAMFAEFHPAALLWILAGIGGYNLRKRQVAGHTKALEDARRFFDKYRAQR